MIKLPALRTMMLSAFVLLLLLTASCVSAGTNEEGLKFLAENREKEGVVELPSGLQYKILKSGDGIYHPSVGTPCLCHYSGTLIDGTKFDSSYDRGEPTTFAPNQVIKGWTEAMQMMVEGDKWELYIPSDLGYGDRGSPPKIPGGSVLVFQMEILELKGKEEDYVAKLVCEAATGEKCNDREKQYLEKIAPWDATKKSSELDRLKKVLASPAGTIKADLVSWMKRRQFILEQLVATSSSADGEL